MKCASSNPRCKTNPTGFSVGSGCADRLFSILLMTDPVAQDPRVKTKPNRPHRLWRWAFRIVAFGCALLGVAAIAIHLALPKIVREQVRDALSRAGYADATFTVEDASLWGVTLTNIKAGKQGELSVAAAKVNYRPLRVIFGKISHVAIENAAIAINLSGPSDETKPTTQPFDFFKATSFEGIPIWRVDLSNCTVTLRPSAEDDQHVTVKVDGWLWREWPNRLRLSVRLKGESGAPAAIDGSLDFAKRWIDLNARGTDLRLTGLLVLMPRAVTSALDQAEGKVDLRSHFRFADGKPAAEASFELRDGKFITSEDFADVRADGASASLDFTSLISMRTNPGQHVSVSRLLIGPAEKSDESEPNPSPAPNEFRDVQFVFGLDENRRIVITTLQSKWAGGDIATDDAVPVNLVDGSTAFTVVANHIGLGPFLKLVSRGKLSGEGALSGRVTLAVKGSQITFGNGEIRSDGPGTLNFGEQVSDLAGEIAKKDQRLRGQEQQLIAALTHFRYDEIAFVFRRTDSGLSIESKISGRGAQGIKTPLDLTVHFQGLEQILNTYLRATQGVK
jgi:hypothetical protein